MTNGDADRRAEMPGTTPEGSGRKPRDHGAGASNVTARTQPSYQETSGMMHAVVERENTLVSCHCSINCEGFNLQREPPWYGTVCLAV